MNQRVSEEIIPGEKQKDHRSALLPTRRRALTVAASVICGLAAGGKILAQTPPPSAEKPATKENSGRTSLHQEVEIKASPTRIYELLLDSKQFAQLTGLPAEIGREVGAAIAMFDGIIVGRNIELVPNLRIVQAWRPKYWTPGVYSLVKFELNGDAGKTTIVLDHTGFPEGHFDSLDAGWPIKYWEPMKKFLA